MLSRLAFPDRHLRLDPFHEPFHRGKGLAAMRRTERHGNARLPCRHPAEPVLDRAGRQGEALKRLHFESLKGRRCHRFVGLVIEPHGQFAAGGATRGADKQNVGSRVLIGHLLKQALAIDGAAHEHFRLR